MGQSLPFYVYFRPFKITFNRKIVAFSGIRTHIVKVKGEHADHLVTTYALELCS